MALPTSAASGRCKQIVEPGLGREIEHALGVVGGGFVHARAASRRGGGLFQLGALRGEADFGEAQEDEAEDGLGVLRGGEARVGAELVGGIPKAFFQRRGAVSFSDGAIQCIVNLLELNQRVHGLPSAYIALAAYVSRSEVFACQMPPTCRSGSCKMVLTVGSTHSIVPE